MFPSGMLKVYAFIKRFDRLRSEFRYFLAKFDHGSTFVKLKHPI